MSLSLVTVILGGSLVLVYFVVNALFLRLRSTRERLRKQGIDGLIPYIFLENIPEIKLIQIQETQSRSLHQVASSISHRWPFTIFSHLHKWRNQYELPASPSSRRSQLHLQSESSQRGGEANMADQDNVKHLEDCSVSNALGTWVFSVAGALLAIPVGIKRKSLAPLVFFGTTGTMLDIIIGISQCEREHAERQMKLLEEAQATAGANNTSTETDS